MTETTPNPRTVTDAWAVRLAETFGLSAEQLPIDPILDLTRDIAYGVARPAAPFTAYVVGLAAGLAGGSAESIDERIKTALGLLEEQDDEPPLGTQ